MINHTVDYDVSKQHYQTFTPSDLHIQHAPYPLWIVRRTQRLRRICTVAVPIAIPSISPYTIRRRWLCRRSRLRTLIPKRIFRPSGLRSIPQIHVPQLNRLRDISAGGPILLPAHFSRHVLQSLLVRLIASGPIPPPPVRFVDDVEFVIDGLATCAALLDDLFILVFFEEAGDFEDDYD